MSMVPTAPPATGDRVIAFAQRCTSLIAMLGGGLALAMALLVTTSILGRWLFNMPIEGDFEFVKMGTAIGVFAYLPYTQARRGNIMVDTFTSWMSPRHSKLADAFWDLVYALMMGFLAFGLAHGTLEAFRSGETTMQLLLLVWPVIGLCCVLCALLSLTAIVTAYALVRTRA